MTKKSRRKFSYEISTIKDFDITHNTLRIKIKFPDLLNDKRIGNIKRDVTTELYTAWRNAIEDLKMQKLGGRSLER